MNYSELTAICRKLDPIIAEYILILRFYIIFINIGYILGHKINLNKLKDWNYPEYLSDISRIKLDTSNKRVTKKTINIWHYRFKIMYGSKKKSKKKLENCLN